MPTVALDARDAFTPPLRGWGRYVRELLGALRAIGAPVRALEGRWPGPEVAWEQVGLPLGDLRAKKAWDVLVRAWRRSGLEHRLVIAGADCGEGPRLRGLAGEDATRLELPGYLDDARLDALLRGAAVLAHPSRYEGFGMV